MGQHYSTRLSPTLLSIIQMLHNTSAWKKKLHTQPLPPSGKSSIVIHKVKPFFKNKVLFRVLEETEWPGWIAPDEVTGPHKPGVNPPIHCEVANNSAVLVVTLTQKPRYLPSLFLLWHQGNYPGQQNIYKKAACSETQKSLTASWAAAEKATFVPTVHREFDTARTQSY